MPLEDLVIYRKKIPESEPVFCEFPQSLHPEIQEFLKKQNILALYSHQAEMFQAAEEGKHVVAATPTASGKSLCFYLPVINEILKNPLCRAIFLYPTKALAADQYRALQPWIAHFGRERLDAGVYDGDTTPAERSRIRKQANIILTNPDMLNGSLLPNHSRYGFDFLFSNLKFVVLDELHVYRGAFGSHLANVFRRFSRVCRYYHSAPQFLASSATIANPVELAEKICGKPFVSIEKNGAGSSQKEYVLIQPPAVTGKDQSYYGRESIVNVTAELLPELMEKGESFIAFAKSRKNVEIILKETRDHLKGAGFLGTAKPEQISGYRGGYTPVERRTIEKNMLSGKLSGLVATNALELGIDIGKLSAAVLAGYPGTRASFWQQAGRAGRSRNGGKGYLILDNLPMDQYIAMNPDWLFGGSSENAIVDPDNLLIELAHIRAAAAELPLSLDDAALFPDLGEVIPVLMKMNEVKSMGGRFAWAGGQYPAGEFSMRNIDQNKYQLINQETGQNITEMDEEQAFHEIHEGAVYMHDGDFYQVVKMNLESKMVYAVPFYGNYYTVPGSESNIQVIHSQKERQWERTKLQFGDVNVADFVYMYKKLQFHNHQNLGFEQLSQPLIKSYDTEAAWLKLPENVVLVYRNLLQPDGNGRFVRNNHFQGLAFALKNAALMITMTEKEDIGTAVSTNALELSGMTDSEVLFYFYDHYVGGLGFSEKIYDLIPQVVEQAVRMVSGCPCKDGCAACVGDQHLDKSLVLWGLKNLLEESDPPEGTKVVKWAETKWREKEFRFQELPEKWEVFCKRAGGDGETFGTFFEKAVRTETEGTVLKLFVKEAFYVGWAGMPENRKNLENIVSYYAEVPPGFRIAILQLPEELKNAGISREELSGREKQEKILRRYQTLTGGEDHGAE